MAWCDLGSVAQGVDVLQSTGFGAGHEACAGVLIAGHCSVSDGVCH